MEGLWRSYTATYGLIELCPVVTEFLFLSTARRKSLSHSDVTRGLFKGTAAKFDTVTDSGRNFPTTSRVSQQYRIFKCLCLTTTVSSSRVLDFTGVYGRWDFCLCYLLESSQCSRTSLFGVANSSMTDSLSWSVFRIRSCLFSSGTSLVLSWFSSQRA